MLILVVMVVMVGIVAGAVARGVAPQPHPLGDAGPWLLALVASVAGGLAGLAAGGGDPADYADQAWAVAGAVTGAAVGAAAFVLLAVRANRRTQTGDAGRRGPTPAAGPRG
jgi:membrane associated rhomboid family serine protease